MNQVCDGSRHLFNRDLAVNAVLIEQINMIGGKPPKRRLHRPPDLLGTAVHANGLTTFDTETEFGGENDLITAPGERAPQKRLVREWSIDFGGIKECASQFDGPVQSRYRFPVIGDAIRLAHAHATEPECGNFKSLSAQSAFW